MNTNQIELLNYILSQKFYNTLIEFKEKNVEKELILADDISILLRKVNDIAINIEILCGYRISDTSGIDYTQTIGVIVEMNKLVLIKDYYKIYEEFITDSFLQNENKIEIMQMSIKMNALMGAFSPEIFYLAMNGEDANLEHLGIFYQLYEAVDGNINIWAESKHYGPELSNNCIAVANIHNKTITPTAHFLNDFEKYNSKKLLSFFAV